jgi:hypothetical protein
MQYNTSRELMKIKEYGRSVHDMVTYVMTIEDKEKRQRNAEVIIEVMTILNPQMKAVEDYKHKLWDHLFLISNYQLDVESPYPIPTEEVKQRKPEPIPYPKHKIRWNHFGKKFQDLFDKAIVETDEEKKQGYIQVLATVMKAAYTNWHDENVHDDMIRDELNAMSKGVLVYDPTAKFNEFVDTANTATINPILPPVGRKNNFNNRNKNNRPAVNISMRNAGANPPVGNSNGGGMNRNNKFNRFKKK